MVSINYEAIGRHTEAFNSSKRNRSEMSFLLMDLSHIAGRLSDDTDDISDNDMQKMKDLLTCLGKKIDVRDQLRVVMREMEALEPRAVSL